MFKEATIDTANKNTKTLNKMRQNRTCQLCGHKDSSDKLTHKGNAKFICKDSEACVSRQAIKGNFSEGIESTTKRYVLTTAVIGCPATPALKTLEAYCKDTNAELIVLTIKYKNIEKAEGYISDWLDSDLAKYARYSKFYLGNDIQVLGDIQISPTATNPLTGIAPLCKGKPTIVPCTQLAQQSIATAKGVRPITIWGTGAITEPIYSDSKAGYKGSFHHAISALVVELDDDGDYFIRNLPISSKNYDLTDLGCTYGVDGKVKNQTPYNLVLGDIHVGSQCPKNHSGIEDLVSDMGTANAVILHDVFDGATINHHELGNPFAQQNLPFKNLVAELDANVDYLNYVANFWGNKVYVVDSNHHDFLSKWILAVDWRKDTSVDNAVVYLALASAVMSGKSPHGIYKTALDYASDAYCNPINSAIHFLECDESLVIYENELGIHGHRGSNGARGSKNTWVNSGVKTITEHTHTPFIDKSAFGGGTSTYLTLGYTKGLSSWSNTHVIEYETGKRQQFTIINGKYRAK